MLLSSLILIVRYNKNKVNDCGHVCNGFLHSRQSFRLGGRRSGAARSRDRWQTVNPVCYIVEFPHATLWNFTVQLSVLLLCHKQVIFMAVPENIRKVPRPVNTIVKIMAGMAQTVILSGNEPVSSTLRWQPATQKREGNRPHCRWQICSGSRGCDRVST